MDKYAVWRRGSLPPRSPGTTVSSHMSGEALKTFFFCQQAVDYQLSIHTWKSKFLPRLQLLWLFLMKDLCVSFFICA